jgi:hypothetical protein
VHKYNERVNTIREPFITLFITSMLPFIKNVRSLLKIVIIFSHISKKQYFWPLAEEVVDKEGFVIRENCMLISNFE